MTRVRWTTSGHIKIERANEHLRVFVKEARDFLDTNPYGVFSEDDIETGDLVFRALVREQPDLRLGAIAGDAIHNLRSSLDVLYGIVFPVRDNSYFRFFISAEKHRAHFARHEKPSRQGAVDLYRAAEAYPGGNDTLWLLNSLDNENKHRTLIPCYGGVTNIVETFRDPPQPSGAVSSVSIWHEPPKPICPVEHGAEVHRIAAAKRGQPNVDMDPKIALSIAFGEPEVVKGKSIFLTINKMAEAVDRLVDSFISAGLLPK